MKERFGLCVSVSMHVYLRRCSLRAVRMSVCSDTSCLSHWSVHTSVSVFTHCVQRRSVYNGLYGPAECSLEQLCPEARFSSLANIVIHTKLTYSTMCMNNCFVNVTGNLHDVLLLHKPCITRYDVGN